MNLDEVSLYRIANALEHIAYSSEIPSNYTVGVDLNHIDCITCERNRKDRMGLGEN